MLGFPCPELVEGTRRLIGSFIRQAHDRKNRLALWMHLVITCNDHPASIFESLIQLQHTHPEIRLKEPDNPVDFRYGLQYLLFGPVIGIEL